MADSNCMKFFDTHELVNKVYEDELLDKELQSEQLNFYIKSEIWFLRFINAKDKNNKYKNEIKNAKNEFLNKIKKNQIKCSKRTKVELFLLKNFYFVFRMTSLMWGRLKRI